MRDAIRGSVMWFIGGITPWRLLWVAAAIGLILGCDAAFAGGYCNSCYHQAVVQQVVHEYPQTIVEHQNVFYSVGADVRQYAVTPAAIAKAEAGELERQIGHLQDKLGDARQQLAYQQPQQAMQAVCVIPTGYCLTPTTATPAATLTPAPLPPLPPAAPMQPPQKFSSTAPGGILKAACTKCHGDNGKPKGDVDLTKAISCDTLRQALTKAATGDMPLNGPKLTDEQIKALSVELGALAAQPEPAAQ